MILRFARRALNLPSTNRLGRYCKIAEQVVALGPSLRSLQPHDLQDRLNDLRQHVRSNSSRDELPVKTFALVREAARRSLGQEHVTEQLICGLALHEGSIAEMKTGEGKTLAATLACALNALAGRGVHIAMPNDYLATRDADWMSPVYRLLGISVGVVTQDMDDEDRRRAYACDVTYGMASEFAFDYLRDNMKFAAADTVQRGHAYVIVDEADAILIDDASMPLALFGTLGDQSALYRSIGSIVASLAAADYLVEQGRRVVLTEQGYDNVERKLHDSSLLKPHVSLHDIGSVTLLHHVMQALRAHQLLQRNRDYIVQNDTIIIIDKRTGRMMPGRRYDEGLHQSLEAKESCPISEETQTLTSITYQTFFGLYDKIAGMTGTAAVDAEEYRQIYGLEILAIPTHRPVIRIDTAVMHRTKDNKMRAILEAVNAGHSRGQPVLIGAPSIERSENLATILEKDGWTRSDPTADKAFSVLNAKHHADEAKIIAQAGMPGAVTIATAMAGRGTDILLGGIGDDLLLRDRVVGAGGLLVIGTEHHDHRRLDDQLRGRSGRQGDPGRTVFHSSLEDDLFSGITPTLNADDDGLVNPSIAERLVDQVQKRNEMRSFNDRMSLLRFDATMQRQRRILYDLRRTIRDDPQPIRHIHQFRNETIVDIMERYAPASGSWNTPMLDTAIRAILTLAVPLDDIVSDATGSDALRNRIESIAHQWMERKADAIGRETIENILRRIMLALLDQLWAEQTEQLEHLKRIVRDRRLAPHQIAVEYEIEAFALFDIAMINFRSAVTSHAMRVGVKTG